MIPTVTVKFNDKDGESTAVVPDAAPNHQDTRVVPTRNNQTWVNEFFSSIMSVISKDTVKQR